MSDLAWIQASQQIRCGGLGVRSVEMLASSAFLASAAATLDLQSAILARCQPASDPFIAPTLEIWEALFKGTAPTGPSAMKQSSWDKASIQKSQQILQEGVTTQDDKARLLAASVPGNGDWLKAYPTSSSGLRLDNEVLRIAVGLRLGLPLCEEHPCPCGETVDRSGLHGLSCHTAEGKIARHQMINDIIHRSLSAAGVPSIKRAMRPFKTQPKATRRRNNCALEIRKSACVGRNSRRYLRSIVPQPNNPHTRVGSRGGRQQEVSKIRRARRCMSFCCNRIRNHGGVALSREQSYICHR